MQTLKEKTKQVHENCMDKTDGRRGELSVNNTVSIIRHATCGASLIFVKNFMIFVNNLKRYARTILCLRSWWVEETKFTFVPCAAFSNYQCDSLSFLKHKILAAYSMPKSVHPTNV